MSLTIPSIIAESYEKAKKAREKAYAPYSKFLVGSTMKFVDEDKIYEGCNVENKSFGATICAERNALCQSVLSSNSKELEWVIVVADTERPTAPCGMCLQVMSEFTTSDFPVYIGNLEKILVQKNFSDLMPMVYDTLEL